MRTTVAPDVSVAERPTGHRGTGRGWGRGSGDLDPSLVGLVAEVAYAVGFSNLSHFRRTFCRHTGFMPADLRADRHA